MVFFLIVVREELTSTYVVKIISYGICSSLLLTVFMWLLTSKLHVYESCCARLPQPSAKPSEQRPLCFLLFFSFFLVKNKKAQRRERKKEENSSFFFILLLPYFFFFFILLVICFFSYWDFFSLCLAPFLRSCVLVHSYLIYVLSPFML